MLEINKNTQEFHLQTQNSSYIIKVGKTGHLLQVYYGRKIRHQADFSSILQQFTSPISGTPLYNQSSFALETACLEIGTNGKGDYREPALHLQHGDDGTRVTDLIFDSYEVFDKKVDIPGLPQGIDPHSEVQTLAITLKDTVKPVKVILYYSLFEQADVITRSMVIINEGDHELTVERALSLNLDFTHDNFELVSLEGKWVNEAQINRRPVCKGITRIDSKRGVSSSNHNPFISLVSPDSTEDRGDAYGFSLIYSGNHEAVAEVSPHGLTRVLMGINSFDFQWPLAQGERFYTPEVVMTFSPDGLNKMSQNFHHFINHHLISPHWQGKDKPVQVNNWEATYFDFNEKKLLKLAKKAQKLGAELFVLDDGWFGKRDADNCSLGDFFDHSTKLPEGIAGISEKIRDLGLDFGIWVEPEMISEDSELYRQHPEWAMTCPDRSPSFGRNQLVLDMTNPAVIDYLFNELCDVFHRCKASFVKWDHNRNFSDVYSHHLTKEQQHGYYHRYMLGVYDLLFRLQAEFPEVLFESCSSGGNRFDMGMLYFMPQTWTSDNTDAAERMNIQYGTSLVYPPNTMGAHVSGRPSHQVLRMTPIETRFNVAAFGVLGYQLDITKLTSFEEKAIKAQITFYKQHRQLLQYGRFYRLESPFETNRAQWMVVNEAGDEALVGYYQKLQESNRGFERMYPRGLQESLDFTITSRKQFMNIRQFGDLVNNELPVNIRDRGVIHGLAANHYMHESEQEEYKLSGDALAFAGIPLKPQFIATELNEHFRFIGDFGSRIYHIKKAS